MEQMRYKLLYRWFVGLSMDDELWNHSVFSKSRDPLFAHEVVESFFGEIAGLAEKQGLLSKEHLLVDGILIQAWVSQKSFSTKGECDDELPSDCGRNADK